MAYTGPDRRIHRILRTENTEYHMRERVCVRVRDRRTGRWLDRHVALMQQLVGSLSLGGDGSQVNTSEVPCPGECMFFDSPSGPVITSPLLDVERPPLALVRGEYPASAAAASTRTQLGFAQLWRRSA